MLIMLVDTCAIQARAFDRAEISTAIDAYLAQGGQIETLPFGVSGNEAYDIRTMFKLKGSAEAPKPVMTKKQRTDELARVIESMKGQPRQAIAEALGITPRYVSMLRRRSLEIAQ